MQRRNMLKAGVVVGALAAGGAVGRDRRRRRGALQQLHHPGRPDTRRDRREPPHRRIHIEIEHPDAAVHDAAVRDAAVRDAL